MQCTSCGNNNPDGVRFCVECGNDLSSVTEPSGNIDDKQENRQSYELNSGFSFISRTIIWWLATWIISLFAGYGNRSLTFCDGAECSFETHFYTAMFLLFIISGIIGLFYVNTPKLEEASKVAVNLSRANIVIYVALTLLFLAASFG